jgi:hypothetical protein
MRASSVDSSWWLSRIARLPKVKAFWFDLFILAGVLALIKARGAANLVDALFLEPIRVASADPASWSSLKAVRCGRRRLLKLRSRSLSCRSISSGLWVDSAVVQELSRRQRLPSIYAQWLRFGPVRLELGDLSLSKVHRLPFKEVAKLVYLEIYRKRSMRCHRLIERRSS